MKRFFILFFSGILPFIALSQKKKDYVIQDIQGFSLDGNTSEWNNIFYNQDSDLWSFAVSTVDDKIVCAIKIKDKALQMEALRGGILVDIHQGTKKTKQGTSLVFPFPDREKLRAIKQENDEGEKVEVSPAELLGTSRGYMIKGFHKVVDGLLSFDNEYGIKAVVKIDDHGVMHYESEIPLNLFNIKSKDLAILLSVNTRFSMLESAAKERKAPTYGGVYAPPQRRPEIKNPYKENTSVWVYGNVK